VNDAPTADGGPGFLAFVAFFLLALALWFLMRNMNARMRRMSYRQQQAHRGPNDPQAAPDEASAGELRDERDGDEPDAGKDPPVGDPPVGDGRPPTAPTG
jgi:flagellar biosynthesis/type III secretory pathway M-ring protein FliF/YscJ